MIKMCLKMSKNDSLSGFMRMRTQACMRGLVHAYTARLHACTCLFLSSCIHMFQPAYVCIVPMYTSLSLCAHTARQKPQLDYLNSFFSSVSHPIENLMPFFIIFASKCDPNIIFHRIVNLTSFCPLCVCVCVCVCADSRPFFW